MDYDCFHLNDNRLFIKHEPINYVELFIEMYLELLTTTQNDIYIIIDDSVGLLHSSYIGAIMSLAVLADHAGKTLHISCSEGLERWFRIIGGTQLLINLDGPNDR